jgi:hypothetical protein
MKYQVDFKSVLIGFLGAALLVATYSFKNQNLDNESRYQTKVATNGIVILDTKTGAFIINTDLSNYGWRKGDFTSTHKTSKGNVKADTPE